MAQINAVVRAATDVARKSSKARGAILSIVCPHFERHSDTHADRKGGQQDPEPDAAKSRRGTNEGKLFF
jgi:hypothetical protein